MRLKFALHLVKRNSPEAEMVDTKTEELVTAL
jgi:hypothetical protein